MSHYFPNNEKMQLHRASSKTSRIQHSRDSDIMVTVKGESDIELPTSLFNSCHKRPSIFNIRIRKGKNGQRLVIKWVRESHYCDYPWHMDELVTAANETASLITSFRERIDMRGWKIRVVKPLVLDQPKHVGVEPYIRNFEEFSNPTFRETDASRTYEQLILALAHFSYVQSGGRFVLANLKGGVDDDGRVVTLLPPSLVSTRKGTYGCKDHGHAEKFLEYHKCNSFCEEIFNQVRRRRSGTRYGGSAHRSGKASMPSTPTCRVTFHPSTK